MMSKEWGQHELQLVSVVNEQERKSVVGKDDVKGMRMIAVHRR